MNPKKSKKKISLTDTQAIDMLLNRIDNEVSYVENLSKDILKDSKPEADKVIKTEYDLDVLNKWSNLSQGNRIVFQTKGSWDKHTLLILRNFVMNSNNQFNSSLLPLINLKVIAIKNKKDELISIDDEGNIILNINMSFVKADLVVILVFLNKFIEVYLRQLSKISKYNVLNKPKQLIKTFIKEAKLSKWKQEVNEDTLDEFMGFYYLEPQQQLIKIIILGVISKYNNKTDSPIEKAAIRCLDRVESQFIVEIYNNQI